MSRRKHLEALQQSIEPPGEGQKIVRALGSRGSNLIEVEYPDGRATLCLLPAKFHKKLWIKKGNFLFVEGAEGAEAGVTGQIVRVLFEEDVKQLKKIAGVWPPEFEQAESSAQLAEQLAGVGLKEGGSAGLEGVEERSGSDSEDDLPPIMRINNRRVIEYEVSDSDSEEEEA